MSTPFRVRIGKITRKSAEVILLPGIERRDLCGEIVPSENVLRAALRDGITDVVIVGRRRDGTLYVGSETNDAERTTGMLMRGVHFMANGCFAQGIAGTHDG